MPNLQLTVKKSGGLEIKTGYQAMGRALHFPPLDPANPRLPAVAARQGKVLGFGPGGVPAALSNPINLGEYPGIVAESYAEAQLLTGLTSGQQVHILSRNAPLYGLANPFDGGGGQFGYSLGDYSAQVASDPLGGIYLPLAEDPTGASGCLVRLYSGAVNPLWFVDNPDNTGATDHSTGFQAASAFAGTGALFVPDGTWRADFNTSAALRCDGFITGTVTYNGNGAFFADKIRASAVVVNSTVMEFSAGELDIDGSFYTGANGKNGIKTDQVSIVRIGTLRAKNCGGTVTYTAGADFEGNDGELLEIGRAYISDCSYLGLQTAKLGTTHAFERTIIGSLLVEDCGGVSAGGNQYHGFYLSSTKDAQIGQLSIRNQANGYGWKVGSSVAAATGTVSIGTIEIDGVTDQGGITIFEPVESFQVGTGTIKNVLTYHVQAYYGDRIDMGSVKMEETSSSPKGTLSNQPAIRIRGNAGELDISRCKFLGWLDGSIRRGMLNALLVDSGVTLDRLICHGASFKLLRERIFDIDGTITAVSVVSPTVDTCGGVWDVAGAISRGYIGGIYGVVGSLTNAWKLPARNAELTVENNILRSGATVIRLNDAKYGRHFNTPNFEGTYWIDTATGIAVIPATNDTEFPDASLGDGYAGKIYSGGAWKNFAAIVP